VEKLGASIFMVAEKQLLENWLYYIGRELTSQKSVCARDLTEQYSEWGPEAYA
jgi:hypothetical protein